MADEKIHVEFESHLDEVIKATDEALARAAEIIGGMAESYAKEYITEQEAVDTGNLRNSITHTAEDDNHTVVVGSAVEYAPYVELGTGVYAEGGGGRQTPWWYQDDKGVWHRTIGMKPRPYLRPAIQNHLEEYKKVLETELQDG